MSKIHPLLGAATLALLLPIGCAAPDDEDPPEDTQEAEAAFIAYKPPPQIVTLWIDSVDPIDVASPGGSPVENRPVDVHFTVQNASSRVFTGYVTGTYGASSPWSTWTVTSLAPGASHHGVLKFTAPEASTLSTPYLQISLDDASGPLLLTGQSAPVAARFELTLESFYASATRSPWGDNLYAAYETAIDDAGCLYGRQCGSGGTLMPGSPGYNYTGFPKTSLDVLPTESRGVHVGYVLEDDTLPGHYPSPGPSASALDHLHVYEGRAAQLWSGGGVDLYPYYARNNPWDQDPRGSWWVNCDGVAAAGRMTFTAQDLYQLDSGQTYVQQQSHGDYYAWYSGDYASCYWRTADYITMVRATRNGATDDYLFVYPPQARLDPGQSVSLMTWGSNGTGVGYSLVGKGSITNGVYDSTGLSKGDVAVVTAFDGQRSGTAVFALK